MLPLSTGFGVLGTAIVPGCDGQGLIFTWPARVRPVTLTPQLFASAETTLHARDAPRVEGVQSLVPALLFTPGVPPGATAVYLELSRSLPGAEEPMLVSGACLGRRTVVTPSCIGLCEESLSISPPSCEGKGAAA